MWKPDRMKEFDSSFADRLDRGWNRQLVTLVFVVAVYAALLGFQPRGWNAAIILIAPACGVLAYHRRRSYEIYDLMFAECPMRSSQRTVAGIRFGIVAELLLHGVCFLLAATSAVGR